MADPIIEDTAQVVRKTFEIRAAREKTGLFGRLFGNSIARKALAIDPFTLIALIQAVYQALMILFTRRPTAFVSVADDDSADVAEAANLCGF